MPFLYEPNPSGPSPLEGGLYPSIFCSLAACLKNLLCLSSFAGNGGIFWTGRFSIFINFSPLSV